MSLREYSGWLKKCTTMGLLNDYYAACKYCPKPISLSNMGSTALDSHRSGIKHQEKENAPKLTFKKQDNIVIEKNSITSNNNNSITFNNNNSNTSENSNISNNASNAVEIFTEKSNQSNVTQNVNSKGIYPYLIKDAVTRAEIIWTLTSVYKYISNNTAAYCTDVMKFMFSESLVTQKMQLQSSKLGYSITYGLGPYCNKQVIDKISNCKYFAVSFDESYNKKSQKEQLDIHIRYFNDEKNQVESQYLSSAFLGHTRASDILSAFKTQLSKLDVKKLVQIAMDGPRVNFKFLSDFKKDIENEYDDSFKLFDLGSCGIHTVHNALKCGFKESQWELTKFFRSINYLFKDTSARIEDYVELTDSDTLPFKFCATRWVENAAVAERSMKILVNLRKFKEEVEKLKIKDIMKNENFKNMVQFLNDDLIEPKLAFFHTIASDMEPFLTMFRSDKPMLPFLYDGLQSLIRTLMDKFVKSEVIQNNLISKIDVTKSEYLVDDKIGVNIGYNTRAALKKCGKKITQQQHATFQKDCLLILKSIVLKLLDKSPLKYPSVKSVSFFDPSIIYKTKNLSLLRLKKTLEIFIDNNRMTGVDADKIEREFKSLLDNSSFIEFAKNYERKERLDDFWAEIFSTYECSNRLKFLLQAIFIFFHGNASV